MTNLHSQPYENPFGSETTSFNILQIIADGMLTDSIYSVGDTTIASKEYICFLSSNSGDKYFVRSEPDYSKIYQLVNDTEFVVSDLSLEKNDTFHLHYDTSIDTIIVDTVFYLNSKKHIILNYPKGETTAWEKLEFIEGVGTNRGLFFQNTASEYIFNEAWSLLLCSYKNGENVYTNSFKEFAGKCNVLGPLDIKQNNDNIYINIFPNPVSNILSIKTKENLAHKQVTILNLDGKILFSNSFSSNDIEIDFSSFNSGLYLLRISDSNNNYNNYLKIIKK